MMDIIAAKQSGKRIMKKRSQQCKPYNPMWQLGGPSKWQTLLVALIENGYWTSFKQTLCCPLFVDAAETLDENTEEYYGANILHLVVANNPPMDIIECILQTFPETVSCLYVVVCYADFCTLLTLLLLFDFSHSLLIVLDVCHFILPQAFHHHRLILWK